MRRTLVLSAALAFAGGCATYERTYGPEPHLSYQRAVQGSDTREANGRYQLVGEVESLGVGAGEIVVRDRRTSELVTLTVGPTTRIYTEQGHRLGVNALGQGAEVRASYDVVAGDLPARHVMLLSPPDPLQLPPDPSENPGPPPVGDPTD
ncbi:MAG: hypothetical protein ACK4N5_00825 [Myxococcales bacterium]